MRALAIMVMLMFTMIILVGVAAIYNSGGDWWRVFAGIMLIVFGTLNGHSMAQAFADIRAVMK